MEQNRAAWLEVAGQKPFEYRSLPIPRPGPEEVVIRNSAVAVNPINWKIQDDDIYLNKYPAVLGMDAAGTVIAVGEGVTRFQPGDRIMGNCHGVSQNGRPANSAFQLYPTVSERLAAPIPDNLTFEKAVVLPLAISTAAAGLYAKEILGLPLPTIKPSTTGKTILVWGGSSSVGTAAIQLAVASGIQVITRASTHNVEFVKSLGAVAAMDHRSPTVVADIATALRTTNFVGVYDAISTPETTKAISAIFDELDVTLPVASVHPVERLSERFAPKFAMAFNIAWGPNAYIGKHVWQEYLPRALQTGSVQAKPDPYVVGSRLEDIQQALGLQKEGVSARKIVVTLEQ